MNGIFFVAIREGFEKGLPDTFSVLKTLSVSDPLDVAQLNELSELSDRIKSAELTGILLNSRVPAIKAELVKLNTAQLQRKLRDEMYFKLRDSLASLDNDISEKDTQLKDLNNLIEKMRRNRVSLSRENDEVYQEIVADIQSQANDEKRIVVLTTMLQELLPGDSGFIHVSPDVDESDTPEWVRNFEASFNEENNAQILLGKLEEGKPLMVGNSFHLSPGAIASIQGKQGKTQVQKRTLPEEADLIKKKESLPDKGLDSEDDFGVVRMEVEINEPKKRQTRFNKWFHKLFPKGFWNFLVVTMPLALWAVVKWILLLLWKLIKWVFSLIVKLFDRFLYGTEKKEESKSEEKPENISPVGQGMEG